MNKEGGVCITEEDLSFSLQEIKELFLKSEKTLSDSDADKILALTNGWPLVVSALSKMKSCPIQHIKKEMLVSYLKKQIWSNWDADMKAFILKSSVVDEIPVELCVRLTGREDSGKILNDLCCDDFIIRKTTSGTYIYQRILLDIVRKLPEYHNMDLASLYDTAAEYYFEEGEFFAGCEFSIKCGRKSSILRLCENFLNNQYSSFDEFLSYVKNLKLSRLLDRELCKEYPVLYIICAIELGLEGDTEKYIDCIDKLILYLPVIAKKHPQFLKWAYMILFSDFRDHSKLMKKYMSKYVLESSNEIVLPTVNLQLPFFHRGLKDFSYIALSGHSRDELKECLPFLVEYFPNILLLLESGILLEQNRLKEALNIALETLYLSGSGCSLESRFSAYTHLLAVHYRMDNKYEYDKVLKEVTSFVEKHSQFATNFKALNLQRTLWLSNMEAAEEWLSDNLTLSLQKNHLHLLYQFFTTIRAYIVLCKFNIAQDLLAQIIPLLKGCNRVLDLAEAEVLRAIVSWAKGEKDTACDILTDLLVEIEPYKFIRVVADEGAAVLPMLKKIISAKTRRIDHKYLNTLYLTAYDVSKKSPGLLANYDMQIVTLSKSQKKMLSLLAQGYSKADIVNETGLSINTVKSHIKIVFEKLNVNDKADAVIRARELSLIE